MLDKWLNSYKNWANFILRSFVGVIFMAHGAQKLFGVFGGPGLEGAARYFEQLGFVPGNAWAFAVAVVEFIGGGALLVGLLTRYAALMLAGIMAVAMISVHMPNGFFLPNGIEFTFVLFAANLNEGGTDDRIPLPPLNKCSFSMYYRPSCVLALEKRIR